MSKEVNAKSAEDKVYWEILRRIRLGELRPNARVRSEEVAASMNLSRQPVREAICRLEAEGFLMSRPNRGAIVRPHTPEQLLEFFEIRAALEGAVAHQAALVIRESNCDSLEKHYRSMKEAAIGSTDWHSAHMDFHLQIPRIANRPIFERDIARLYSVLEPYFRRAYLEFGNPDNLAVEHEQILKAVGSGYPRHAEEVVREHVLRQAPRIMELVEIDWTRGYDATDLSLKVNVNRRKASSRPANIGRLSSAPILR